jgi:hypothetical protein
MNRVAEAVAPQLETEILVQGTLSRQRIIEEFRDSAEASLFAVTSFWQGIDVPGHSLSLVTIDRLPFAVPNDPLAEARRSRNRTGPSTKLTCLAPRCSRPRRGSSHSHQHRPRCGRRARHPTRRVQLPFVALSQATRR